MNLHQFHHPIKNNNKHFSMPQQKKHYLQAALCQFVSVFLCPPGSKWPDFWIAKPFTVNLNSLCSYVLGFLRVGSPLEGLSPGSLPLLFWNDLAANGILLKLV